MFGRIIKYTKEYEYLAKEFTCGNFVIDKYLKSDALTNNRGITYIWLANNEDTILGYYTIEVGNLDRFDSVRGTTLYESLGGSVNIRYFATSNKVRGKELMVGTGLYPGSYLLSDCELRVLNLSKEVGISFIVVFTTENGYRLFHERNAYFDFDEDMYVPVYESDAKCYRLYKHISDIVILNEY